MDVLTEIMAHKRHEIAPRIRNVTLGELEALNAKTPRPASFAPALRRADARLAIIAEIKRRSPSAGPIASATLPAADQAMKYKLAGADALSILTDEKYFGGTLDDLRDVVKTLGGQPPKIRKDFMVHPIQVVEAREAGASAILIIVRALTDDDMSRLFESASAAGLDSLFEIHTSEDMDRSLRQGAKIIGVNNRDLAVFRTDLTLSERLIPQLPKDVIAISESGIVTADDARRVRAAGASAILVGETLMKAANPADMIAAFRSA